MITKEQKINKYCCLYVSDFHLEMILLPFIKNSINNSNVIIFTEKNLENTIKILLDRTNFKIEDKEQILDIKYWTNDKNEDLLNYNLKDCTIIINGSRNYIETIENKINNLNYEKINIVHCLDLNKNDLNITEIAKNYKKILNTKA